jgi:sulfoxide reductase heme-binding subunit YedZ
VHRLSGRQATRNSHMVLATLTLAFGGIHVLCFLFLTDINFDVVALTVPMADGLLRHAYGIIGFEVILAVAISVGFQRYFRYRRWLSLHRFAYPAVALLVVHSLFGAVANGHIDFLWLGGLTFLVPTVVLAVLRFVPSKLLSDVGLVSEDA